MNMVSFPHKFQHLKIFTATRVRDVKILKKRPARQEQMEVENRPESSCSLTSQGTSGGGWWTCRPLAAMGKKQHSKDKMWVQ